MTPKTIAFLRRQEWSMGNGQCPYCCAVHRGWTGHPLYPYIEETGHNKNCLLASCLEELGETVQRKVEGFTRPRKPFDPDDPMLEIIMDIWEGKP